MKRTVTAKLKRKTEKEINQREYFYSMLPSSESGRLEYMPTVTNLLNFASREHSSRPALSDGETVYTYAELARRCAVRRGFFKNAGLGLGDRIAIFTGKTSDAYEIFLSAVTNGSIAVIIPFDTDSGTLGIICRKFGINAVICDESFEDTVISAGCTYYLSDFSLCGHYSVPPYESIKDSVCAICLIKEGLKGAVLTHGSVMRGAFNGCFVPGGVMYRKYYSFFPASDVRGFIRSFLSSLYTGGLLYTADRADEEGFSEMSPDTLILDNAHAENIINDSDKLSDIKTFILADKPAAEELIRQTEALGIGLMQSFSIPECGGIVAGSQDAVLKTGSAGFMYPEVNYKITGGELRINGDSVMLGYYSDVPADISAFDSEGWYRTGFNAKKDEDGFLYIEGRTEKSDSIEKRAEISLDEIEKIFLRSDYIKDCFIKEEKISGNKIFTVEILPEEKHIKELNENEKKELFRNTVKGINKTLPLSRQIKKIIIKTDNINKNA